MSANIPNGGSLTVYKILKLSKLHFELIGSYLFRGAYFFNDRYDKNKILPLKGGEKIIFQLLKVLCLCIL